MWILIDLVLVLGALAVLTVVGLGLWRRVKALSRTVAQAGETVGAATERLAAVQDEGQAGSEQRQDVTPRPPGVPRRAGT